VLLVTPPPVPVTVTVYVPNEMLEGAIIVRVLVAVGFGVTLDELSESDRPLGEDVAVSVTAVGEPLTKVTVIIEVLLAPRQIERTLGLADIEKSNRATK